MFERHAALRALGSHGGSDMLDIIIHHPLSPARIRDGLENPLILLRNTCDEKIRRLRRLRHASATTAKLFPMPISIIGAWHPDALRAMGTIAVNIASRTEFTSLRSHNVVSAPWRTSRRQQRGLPHVWF